MHTPFGSMYNMVITTETGFFPHVDVLVAMINRQTPNDQRMLATLIGIISHLSNSLLKPAKKNKTGDYVSPYSFNGKCHQKQSAIFVIFYLPPPAVVTQIPLSSPCSHLHVDGSWTRLSQLWDALVEIFHTSDALVDFCGTLLLLHSCVQQASLSLGLSWLALFLLRCPPWQVNQIK